MQKIAAIVADDYNDFDRLLAPYCKTDESLFTVKYYDNLVVHQQWLEENNKYDISFGDFKVAEGYTYDLDRKQYFKLINHQGLWTNYKLDTSDYLYDSNEEYRHYHHVFNKQFDKEHNRDWSHRKIKDLVIPTELIGEEKLRREWQRTVQGRPINVAMTQDPRELAKLFEHCENYVEDLCMVCPDLIISDEYGTILAENERVHGQRLRDIWRQILEKCGEKYVTFATLQT